MNKSTKLALALTSTIIGIVLVYSYSSQERIEKLDPPVIKALPSVSSSNLLLSGSAYPRSKILVYLDDHYIDDIFVDEVGSFTKVVALSEGIKKLKFQQIYKNISSNFTDEYSVKIDSTPPDASLLKVTNLPSISKVKIIVIKGNASPSDYLIIGGVKYQVNPNGSFEINYNLIEGINEIKIAMADEFDNRTEVLYKHSIFVDTTPPKLETDFCLLSDKFHPTTEEYVCIKIGNWQGYLDSYNSVAITGSVEGNIKSIFLDGKRVTWDENNEIYQRLKLYIHGGLNKYKVVVEDTSGNRITGYVETDAERTEPEYNLNINE